MDDASAAVKISSLSGANRKRKLDEDGDKSKESDASMEETSGTSDSSSEEEGDEVEDKARDEVLEKAAPAVKEEQEEEAETKIVEGKKEEKTFMRLKNDCQPAVFIPIDRLPEIQVKKSQRIVLFSVGLSRNATCITNSIFKIWNYWNLISKKNSDVLTSHNRRQTAQIIEHLITTP